MSEKKEVSGYKVGGVEEAKKAKICVDLRSDTVTKPSQEMRTAMATAQVGDDVLREDPTTIYIEELMAKNLGKEEGLFVSSGTMGNLLATLVHCNNRGSEAIVGSMSHQFMYEQGGMAQFGGVQANPLRNNPDGTFDINEILRNIRADDVHFPKTSLIGIENTHNMTGGRVVPLDWIDKVGEIGREYSIPLHMDGARLFNAVYASNVPATRIVRDFSSVTVCLSKNLGAPAGSVLVGNSNFIAQARRLRKALGGGMRQVGILAAAGIFAIERMEGIIKADHANTKMIAQSVYELQSPVLSVQLDKVETNILMLNTNGVSAQEFCERLTTIGEGEKETLGSSIGVLAFPRTETQLRMVLHCDISKDMAGKAAQKIGYVAQEFASRIGK